MRNSAHSWMTYDTPRLPKLCRQGAGGAGTAGVFPGFMATATARACAPRRVCWRKSRKRRQCFKKIMLQPRPANLFATQLVIKAVKEPVRCRKARSNRHANTTAATRGMANFPQRCPATNSCCQCGGPRHIARYCPAPMPVNLVPQQPLKLGRSSIAGQMLLVTSNSFFTTGSTLHLGWLGRCGGL